MKNQKTKGITLIALVITIIVLFLLAGVTIAMLTGDNGILGKANQIEEENNKQTATEKINLKITTAQMSTYAEQQRIPTLKELSLSLKEDGEIQYVMETSQVASAEYDVKSDHPSLIYTKLKDYSYEFGIDDKLKLAMIDGVKLADNTNADLEKRIDQLEQKLQEQFFTGTELLQERVVVETTEAFTNRNQEVSLAKGKSIKDYEFLLLEFGNCGKTPEETAFESTLLISVDKIKYTNDVQKIQFCFNAASGPNYSTANINFKDDKTLKIVNTGCSNNAGRKYFAIESIKGIK